MLCTGASQWTSLDCDLHMDLHSKSQVIDLFSFVLYEYCLNRIIEIFENQDEDLLSNLGNDDVDDFDEEYPHEAAEL